MNRMKSLAGAVALATIAAVSVSAAPGGFGKGPRGGHQGRHGGDGHGLRDLDLTEQQRTQIREMVKSHREANQPLFDRMKDAREQLHEARRSGTTDATRIGQLTLAVDAQRKQLEASRLQLREQIASVLTPEQREKLEKAEAERKQKREEWREKKDERREQRQGRRR
jgi:periplasmic protein CpxP/Spy